MKEICDKIDTMISWFEKPTPRRSLYDAALNALKDIELENKEVTIEMVERLRFTGKIIITDKRQTHPITYTFDSHKGNPATMAIDEPYKRTVYCSV